MLTIKDCLPIGILTRTHGAQGSLVLKLQTLTAKDFHEMEWVFVEVDGLPVPFFVRNVRELNVDKVILSLDAVTSDCRAKELVGSRLLIPSTRLAEKAIPKNDYLNIDSFQVRDIKYGNLGIAAEIMDITGNPLLRIISGKKELFVPAHPDIVLEISVKEKFILIKAPEGLIEL
ncbi:MAG: hypothetical protein JW973_01625 [Bacteroidales bacterium]|nr:hypothetical protein [Bacteroidales bacterium]